MTSENLIKETAKAIAAIYGEPSRWANYQIDARAAIRVIAPAAERALRERDQAVEALDNIRALAVKHQDYGGPNGILAAIEGFARTTLTSIEGTGHE